jgi:DNA polymerase-3 subunit alpha
MQKYLRELKPDKFADLIAMNALYRPGPIAYIPNFIDRKHGKEAITYDLADMEEYLADTYGITVYQEQVMLLSQKIGGFSKGDADVLRKAMGKKDRKTLDKMKGKFVDGAIAKGHAADKLEKIWTDWEAFAQYAFNKSHSTCYAYVAYETAYLKAHYPGEYMSAVLNHAGGIEKITFFMEECKRMGIKVLGPDINESLKGFAVNAKGEIRFGMGGIKGVGEAAVEYIIAEREKNGFYTDMFDFISRVIQKSVNKKSLESLAYSGAFDCFTSYHRAQYFNVSEGDKLSGLEKIVSYGQAKQANSIGNSNTLFGNMSAAMEVPIPKIAPCEQWTLTELLDYEKEVTGMYMSGHPLDHFKFELKYYGITRINDFNEIKETLHLQPNPGRGLKVAGLIIDVQHRVTKTGKNFGSFSMEDFTGKTEFLLWSEDYIKFQNYLDKGQNVLLNGTFRPKYNRPDEFEFKIYSMSLLETVKQTLTKSIDITLNVTAVTHDFVNFIDKNMKDNPGKTSLRINLYEPKENLKVSLYSMEKSFLMNEDMAGYLLTNPDLDIHVGLAN